MDINVIGQSLLEAAAQTFVGAIASYGFDKIKNNSHKDNTFDGAFDFCKGEFIITLLIRRTQLCLMG